MIAGSGSSGHNTKVFQRALKPNPDIWRINSGSAFDWQTSGIRYYSDLHYPRHFPESGFKGLKNQIRAIPMVEKMMITKPVINIAEIVKRYRCTMFASSVSLLMAKACIMGYKTIVLPGIDSFSFESDPIEHEAHFAFWLGYLKEKGIKVVTSTAICRNQSDLNRESFQYGKEMFLAESGHRSVQLVKFLDFHGHIYN